MKNLERKIEEKMVQKHRGTPQTLNQCLRNALDDIDPNCENPVLVLRLHLREFFANKVALLNEMNYIEFFHRIFED